MMEMMDSLQSMLEKIKPGTVPADKRNHPANIHKNADGTVTVGEKADATLVTP
jgi:hypothetical protein